jgi:hypothetical protein
MAFVIPTPSKDSPVREPLASIFTALTDEQPRALGIRRLHNKATFSLCGIVTVNPEKYLKDTKPLMAVSKFSGDTWRGIYRQSAWHSSRSVLMYSTTPPSGRNSVAFEKWP